MAAWFKRLVSFSDLDLFDLCERKFYFEKILKEPQKPSAILEVGQTYHAALAAFWTVDLPDPLRLAAAAVVKHTEALAPFGVNLPGLIDELKGNLERLMDKVLLPGKVTPLYVERRFDNHRLGFKGIIDILSHATPIVDEKGHVTGSSPEPCVLDYKSLTSDRRRSQRDCEMSPQLALYALEAGVSAAGFVEIPRNLEKEIKTRIVHYSPEDLANWLLYLQGQRRTLFKRGKKKENFRMCSRKNPLCNPMWCAHFLKCYACAPMPEQEEGCAV